MRKNDKSNIKTFQIKNHMCLFINCLIPNPSFDNQTKDYMNLQRSKFIKTSEYTPSEGFIKKSEFTCTRTALGETKVYWHDFL